MARSASPPTPAAIAPVLSAVRAIEAERDCDVIFYNGPILRPFDDEIINACTARRRRTNALLLLTSFGGDAHAAYRIARCLQHNYTNFSVFIHGYCKSAGTLIATGAHELIVERHAELGPLDVQVQRRDELGERESGLTPQDALTVLEKRAQEAFASAFNHMRFVVGLTTQKAAEISVSLVCDLYAEMFQQLDPMKLGELDRANRIALYYGQRLAAVGKNITEDALARLVTGYPSHGFVIDSIEAKELFKRVRGPSDAERVLVKVLDAALRSPIDGADPLVTYLSEEIPNGTAASDDGADSGSPSPSTGNGAARTRAPSTAKSTDDGSSRAGNGRRRSNRTRA